MESFCDRQRQHRQAMELGAAGLPSSRTTIANGFVGLSLTAPLNGLQIDQPYVDAKGSFESGRIQLEATEKNLEEQVRTSAIGIDLDWQALEVAEKALGYAATAVAVERNWRWVSQQTSQFRPSKTVISRRKARTSTRKFPTSRRSLRSTLHSAQRSIPGKSHCAIDRRQT